MGPSAQDEATVNQRQIERGLPRYSQSRILPRLLDPCIALWANEPRILGGVAFHRLDPIQDGVFGWEFLAADRTLVPLLSAFGHFEELPENRLAPFVVREFFRNFSAEGLHKGFVPATKLAKL